MKLMPNDPRIRKVLGQNLPLDKTLRKLGVDHVRHEEFSYILVLYSDGYKLFEGNVKEVWDWLNRGAP